MGRSIEWEGEDIHMLNVELFEDIGDCKITVDGQRISGVQSISVSKGVDEPLRCEMVLAFGDVKIYEAVVREVKEDDKGSDE